LDNLNQHSTKSPFNKPQLNLKEPKEIDQNILLIRKHDKTGKNLKKKTSLSPNQLDSGPTPGTNHPEGPSTGKSV